MFSISSNISTQLTINTGEMNNEHNEYGKVLLKTSYKRNLLKVHTGENNHECNICGQIFSKLDNVSAHIKSHWRKELWTQCMWKNIYYS